VDEAVKLWGIMAREMQEIRDAGDTAVAGGVGVAPNINNLRRCD
jgi:hypothetical protein